MRIIQAISLIETGYFSRSEGKENTRKPSYEDWNRCFRFLMHTDELNPIKRYEYYQLLKSRVEKCRPQFLKPILLAKIEAAANLALIKRKAFVRNVFEMSRENWSVYFQKDELKHYLHFVLDSNLPKNLTDEGVIPVSGISFLRNSFLEFEKQAEVKVATDRHLLKGLVKDLTDTLDFQILVVDYSFAKEKKFESHLVIFQDLLMDRLKVMQEGKRSGFPSVLLSTGPIDHAVTFLITYSLENKFSIAIINTGEGGISAGGNFTKDLCFSRLFLEDFHFLSHFILNNRSGTMKDFLQEFRRLLPLWRVEKGFLKRHKCQNGSSCVAKSAMHSLRLIMPDYLYREFKVFLSEKLHANIQDEELKELGETVIARRKLKASLHKIEA